jgi:hypothetical protein
MIRRSTLALAIVCPILWMAGCASGDGRGGSAPGPSEGPARAPSTSPADVSTMATRIEQLGQQRYPDQYAGLEVAGDKIVVYRRPSPEFDAAVRAAGAGSAVGVEFRDASYSARQLDQLRARVVADIGFWKDRGIAVYTVHARHDGSAVEVSAPEVEPAQREMTQRYGGAPPVVVVRGAPVVPVGQATG